MNTLNVIMVTVPMSFPLHCHYSSHLSVSQTIVINCARRSNTVDYKSSHSKRPRKQPLWASRLPLDESLRWSNRLGYDALISFLDIASQRNLLEKLPSIRPSWYHPHLVQLSLLPHFHHSHHRAISRSHHRAIFSSFANHLFPSIPVSMGRSTNSYAASETS